MDDLTQGLVRACALTYLENLPNLHASGVLSFDALNAARTAILQLMQNARSDEDAKMLTSLLVRLG